MRIPIKILNQAASIPRHAYDAGDAGVDLTSVEELTLHEGQRALVPTGIAVAIPQGYGGFVQPRSGLAAKFGITLTNSPGLIDSNYRGEIKVIIQNTGHSDFEIKVGDRIAQLVIMPVEQAEFEAVDELPESGRGEGGFGSSGQGNSGAAI
ncbi:MAG: dUTP diphosphatase [Thermoleophilia bacterium]